MKGKIKTIAIAAAVILAAAAGLYAYLGKNNSNVEPVKTTRASVGDLTLKIVATATVTPDVEVIVKSKAGGEILSFPFNEGDLVKTNQVVVKLDPKTEEARANQAEANLLMAEARLEKARIALKDAEVKLERSKRLFEDGIISAQEYDDARITLEKGRADVKLSEAEVLQSREALKEARDRLSDTEIRAPFTGTILTKFVEAGQVIASTLSSASEGTPIFSMANLDNIYVAALVDEVDISEVAPGQKAEISADSLPGRSFEGVVERIAPKGKVERTVTVFEVIVKITDREKHLLKPGMTADVEITKEVRKGVVLIPNEALKTNNRDTGVYVVRGGEHVWTPVKTGKTDGIMTEIREGLSGGEEAVTSGISKKEKTVPRRRFFF